MPLEPEQDPLIEMAFRNGVAYGEAKARQEMKLATSLDILLKSTDDFYSRFDVVPTLGNVLVNLEEELKEALYEIKQLAPSYKDRVKLEGDPSTIAPLLEECVDVMVCILSLALTEVAPEPLLEAIYTVVNKNGAKTTETHVYDPAARKIKRKRK